MFDLNLSQTLLRVFHETSTQRHQQVCDCVQSSLHAAKLHSECSESEILCASLKLLWVYSFDSEHSESNESKWNL